MKPVTLLLAGGLALLAGTAAAKPVIGQAAPAFSAQDSRGQTHTLAAYRGHIVVLEWNNPDCPFVGKQYRSGNMQRQQDEAAAAGAVWLTINSGAPGQQGHLDAAGANAYVARVHGREAAYLLDPDGVVGHAYAAKTTPQMAVIDKDGVLRYLGAIDSIASTDVDDIPKATQYVRVALADLAAGRPVADPLTQPYGCSVKYAR